MSELDYFDVNVSIGRPRMPRFHVVTDAAQVKTELAPFGIAGGLVRHTMSAEWHPSIGNARLDKSLEGVSGFEAAWALLPHWTGEFPAGQELDTLLSAKGIRASALYPGQHNFPTRDTVIAPMLEVLEDRRMLLMLPHAEVPLEVTERIARNYPGLSIVVLETPYSIARELYAVFAACPNVHIDISTYMVHRGIEDIVNRFGAERILFGSRYPTYNPGAAVAAVTYARISDDAKKTIASGNARRLLERVKQ